MRVVSIGGAAACLAIATTVARAAEDELSLLDLVAPRSYISAEIGADGEGSHKTNLDLDLALPGEHRLQLFAGTSRLAGDDTDLDADTLRVGVASDPLASYSALLEYEWWGSRGDIETEAWRLGGTWNGAQWTATLLGEWRDLRFYLQPPFTRLQRYADFDSDAWELSLGYHGFAHWGVTVSRREIDYSVDVTKLGTSRLAPYIFTTTAFGLGSGLSASLTRLEATHYFDRASLGLAWDQTESAIDGSRSYSLALTGSLPLDNAWSLSGRLGQYEFADGDTTPFGSVMLSYGW